jgi:hypothetical protein
MIYGELIHIRRKLVLVDGRKENMKRHKTLMMSSSLGKAGIAAFVSTFTRMDNRLTM